MRDMYIKQYL